MSELESVEVVGQYCAVVEGDTPEHRIANEEALKLHGCSIFRHSVQYRIEDDTTYLRTDGWIRKH